MRLVDFVEYLLDGVWAAIVAQVGQKLTDAEITMLYESLFIAVHIMVIAAILGGFFWSFSLLISSVLGRRGVYKDK